jgi:hypothetical protein
MSSEQIPGLVQGFNFILSFLIQPFIILGDAVRMPNKHHILLSLVHLFHRCTRL